MRLRFLLLLVLLSCGCAHAYFTGAMDLDRVERGEAYFENIALPDGRVMVRVVVMVDAPPWRIFNLQRDIEDYPLWQTGMSTGRVLSRNGDDIDAEFTMQPVGFRQLSPLREHIHLDTAHLQTSLTAYQNDWMKNGQIVVKLSPMGDGNRTLLNFYFQGEMTIAGAKLFHGWAEDRFAQTALNIRRIIQLPQYALQPAPAAGTQRTKVAVPIFTAEGVPAEEARTLTRVFAEALMQQGDWDVSTPQEIAAMLTFNQQQSLLGCDGGSKCALDLGKALGADRLAVGSIGKVGDRFVVSASLVKLPDGSVERRVSRDADQNSLLDGVRAAALQLEHH